MKIWHPNFKGTVTEPVNKSFLEALIKRVWDDETVSSNASELNNTYEKRIQALRAKNIGEILDDDFKESLIRSCATTYFRNIHKSFNTRGDPMKAAKLVQTNVKNRRRGHRSNVSFTLS